MNDTIISFIKRFQEGVYTRTTFLSGCCYWFAFILFFRFMSDGAELMYDEVENHFGTRIKGKVYDINGDVTDWYTWIPWQSITDEALRARITRDCIRFDSPDEV